MTGARGGAAPLLLGAMLLLFLSVAALGSAEFARAAAARGLAERAVRAAVNGAAVEMAEGGPAAARAAFHRLVRANLDLRPDGTPRRPSPVLAGQVRATVRILPRGGRDPLTGTVFSGPAVAGEVVWPLEGFLLPLGGARVTARHAAPAGP